MHEKLRRTRGRRHKMIYRTTKINSINAASYRSIQIFPVCEEAAEIACLINFLLRPIKFMPKHKAMINKVKYNPDEGNRLYDRGFFDCAIKFIAVS